MPDLQSMLAQAQSKQEKKKLTRGVRPDTLWKTEDGSKSGDAAETSIIGKQKPRVREAPTSEGSISTASHSSNEDLVNEVSQDHRANILKSTVESTLGQNDLRSNQPKLDSTPPQHSEAASQVKTTLGQNNPRSNQPKVESIPPQHSEAAPRVESTLGQNDLRSNQPKVESIPHQHSEAASQVKSTLGQSDPGSTQLEHISNENPSSRAKANGFDVSLFVPQGMTIPFVEGEGVFMIPHVINEFAHKVTQSKRELLVFNCLLRYTLGFNRSSCEASSNFIARWTGLDPANARKAIRDLLDSQLIKISTQGNTHLSSWYKVPIVEAYLEFRTPQRQVKSTSGQNNLRSDQPSASGQNDLSPTVNLTHKKDTSNKTINKTLSRNVQSYFDDLPKRKREREREALASFEKDFSPEDISDCFAFVQNKGDLNGSKSVHSPMAYLAMSIADVLPLIRTERKAAQRSYSVQQGTQKGTRSNQTQADSSEMASQTAEVAFCAAFPDSLTQESVIRQILNTRFPKLPLKGPHARHYAVLHWFNEQHQQDSSLKPSSSSQPSAEVSL